MNTHTIFERDLNGEMVSPSDPGYDELINAIWDTMKMATELNAGYHTPDEVRRILSVILGCEVDESITLLPPFYVDYGKHIKNRERLLYSTVLYVFRTRGYYSRRKCLFGAESEYYYH